MGRCNSRDTGFQATEAMGGRRLVDRWCVWKEKKGNYGCEVVGLAVVGAIDAGAEKGRMFQRNRSANVVPARCWRVKALVDALCVIRLQASIHHSHTFLP